MPPVRALQLRLADYDGHRLQLAAPLEANINDKGCAFGGSLTSVMTLSAWALMSLKLEEAGLGCDVYVQDSHVRYLAPLYEDLLAEATLCPDQGWPDILDTLRTRGKARALLCVTIHDQSGQCCCTLEGRFVALRSRD